LRNILAALGKISILGLILFAFAFGLAGTVYLSLRSPNVEVPDVTNKSLRDGETALEATGLSVRERAKRFKSGVEPGVILDQFPRGGSVVKQGQTVAVIVSRAPKEGESPTSDEIVEKEEEKEAGASSNANQNRERKRPAPNRNANANQNANANSGNQNTTKDNAAPRNGNANATNANRPAGNQNANRNTNAGRAGNANDNRTRNSNNRNSSANNSRGTANSPRNGNTNRKPNR
jgi:hypothetical protein